MRYRLRSDGRCETGLIEGELAVLTSRKSNGFHRANSFPLPLSKEHFRRNDSPDARSTRHSVDYLLQRPSRTLVIFTSLAARIIAPMVQASAEQSLANPEQSAFPKAW
jgi:hypothetical protein